MSSPEEERDLLVETVSEQLGLSKSRVEAALVKTEQEEEWKMPDSFDDLENDSLLLLLGNVEYIPNSPQGWLTKGQIIALAGKKLEVIPGLFSNAETTMEDFHSGTYGDTNFAGHEDTFYSPKFVNKVLAGIGREYNPEIISQGWRRANLIFVEHDVDVPISTLRSNSIEFKGAMYISPVLYNKINTGQYDKVTPQQKLSPRMYEALYGEDSADDPNFDIDAWLDEEFPEHETEIIPEDEEDEPDIPASTDGQLLVNPQGQIVINSDEQLIEIFGVSNKKWAAAAACKGSDPDSYFPERGASTRFAKETCMSCSVRMECLAFSIVTSEKFGIWGGKSERERRKVRRAIALGATANELVDLFGEGSESYFKPYLVEQEIKLRLIVNRDGPIDSTDKSDRPDLKIVGEAS